jgi:CheY-like chemotaxis protein
MGRQAAVRGISWHESATIRARDLPMRVMFAVFVAGAGAVAAHGALWPFVWFAIAVTTQVAGLTISEPMRRDPGFPVSARRELVFYVSVGLSAATFAASGALFWFQGGWGGRLFAVILMAAGAVNVALQPAPSSRLMWIGCTPFMIVLQVLPLVSFCLAPPTERGVMAMTAFAATLFIAHLIAAGRRSIVNVRQLDLALIEARRERRRAEVASAAKGDFLGLMSHELRTPLNGVLGMAQAMQLGELTPEQRERLEVIRDSGEVLRELLNDVLDVSKIAEAPVGPDADFGAEAAGDRLRVLAAEDNSTNQLVLKTLLGQAGITVHVVGDGQAAVEAWRGAPWDLLLMDIRMPGMDGVAATRAIRAAEAAEGRRRTPIIAVSAESTPRQASEYLAAGMDGLVPKPIQFAQLAAVIASVIGAEQSRPGRGAAAA